MKRLFARAALVAGLGLAPGLAAVPACAQAPWLGVAASGGLVRPDPDLASFGRDIRPAAQWGLEGRVGRGPWSLGLRGLTGTGAQEMATTGVDVKTTRIELVARRTVARVRGASLDVGASAGRARLSFAPDHVALDDGAGGTIDVALDPVGAWSWGGGVFVERPLAASWSAGIAADVAGYAIDTAHREGGSIVEEKTAFADWGLRLVLGWNTPR